MIHRARGAPVANVRARIDRRSVLAGALVCMAPLSACAAQARVHDLRISRDAGCGCCMGWMSAMARSGRFVATMTDVADMAAVKRDLGVPEDLASCHTATVEGLVIEGHVPAEDIVRLLDTRPAGVRGLAVPGMPLGSPGMEQPDGQHEVYEVYAFGAGGARSVFSRNGA